MVERKASCLKVASSNPSVESGVWHRVSKTDQRHQNLNSEIKIS